MRRLSNLLFLPTRSIYSSSIWGSSYSFWYTLALKENSGIQGVWQKYDSSPICSWISNTLHSQLPIIHTPTQHHPPISTSLNPTQHTPMQTAPLFRASNHLHFPIQPLPCSAILFSSCSSSLFQSAPANQHVQFVWWIISASLWPPTQPINTRETNGSIAARMQRRQRGPCLPLSIKSLSAKKEC